MQSSTGASHGHTKTSLRRLRPKAGSGESSSSGEDCREKETYAVAGQNSRASSPIELFRQSSTGAGLSKRYIESKPSELLQRGKVSLSTKHLDRTKQCETKLFPDSPKEMTTTTPPRATDNSDERPWRSRRHDPRREAVMRSILSGNQRHTNHQTRVSPVRPCGSSSISGSGNSSEQHVRKGRTFKPSTEAHIRLHKLNQLRIRCCVGQGAFGNVFLSEMPMLVSSTLSSMLVGMAMAPSTTRQSRPTSITTTRSARGISIGTESSTNPTTSFWDDDGDTSSTNSMEREVSPRSDSTSTTSSTAMSTNSRAAEDLKENRAYNQDTPAYWQRYQQQSMFPLASDQLAATASTRGFGNSTQVRLLPIALKIVLKRRVVESHMVSQSEMELRVLRIGQRSPFIASLEFAYQTPTKLYIGTEFCPGGELFSRIQRNDLSNHDVKVYLAEIALALRFLHYNNVLYRDLKPENVVLSAGGHVRLVDFGLSVLLETSKHLNPENGRLEIVTNCGTLAYSSPEILRRETHSFESDWWGLGVICFELLNGFPPFGGEDTDDQTFCDMICTRELTPTEAVPPGSAQFDLVDKLLQKTPRERLCFELSQFETDFMVHPFFNGINWDAVKTGSHPLDSMPLINSPWDTSQFDPEFTNQTPVDEPVTQPDREYPPFAEYISIEETCVPNL